MSPEAIDNAQVPSGASSGRTSLDLAIVLMVVAAMVGLCALGPSDTYASAQAWNAGGAMGIVERGDWILPRDQMGRAPRKPPLLAWAGALAILATGAHNDLVFRLPTILSGLATVVLIYLLGRRWFTRRSAVLAACLWAVGMHMSKLLYLATTDMLLTFWITASIFCADRVLFARPGEDARRRGWLVGFWASMILAALSKGWGVINVPVVGLWVALASAVQPGFEDLRALRGAPRLAMAGRLVLRRWGGAIRRIHLAWGLLAMLLVLGGLLTAQAVRGGQEFRQVLKYEYWRRLTGEGEDAEGGSTGRRAIRALQLIYFALPASAFALLAVAVGARRLALPLCWVAAVIVPFTIPQHFRQDYLLPAYGAIALMAGWGVEELARRGPQSGRTARLARHAAAAIPVAFALAVMAGPLAYGLRGHLPASWQRQLLMPVWVRPETWYLAAALAVMGAGVLVAAIHASLTWRIRRLAWLAILAAVGLQYFLVHVHSRHAVQPDGEIVLAFARQARPILGHDSYTVAWAGKLGTELYIGRFGQAGANGCPFTRPDQIERCDAAWLITDDFGLLMMGAAADDPSGPYHCRGQGVFRTRAEDLGQVALASAPVEDRDAGRIYLIRLQRPFHLTARPRGTTLPADE
jgi:4-amino-4-deoxy-L-arabinose transferase-like glycosyltransferase